MNIYEGDFARHYDLFHGDKRYDDEVSFTDRILRDNAIGPSRRLLDVACGTGQHAVGFADLGWKVVGIDRSADMLTRARERAGSRRITFERHDMRDFDLELKNFDAAVCLFDSIGYAASNDGVLAALACIRTHLRPKGLLALEFWHAPAMLREYDAVRVREWELPDSTLVRVSRTSLDIAAQLARVDYSIYQLRKDGTFACWTEAHENRFFQTQEMALFLDASGYEPLRWVAGYDESSAIDASTWHVVVVARARDREAE